MECDFWEALRNVKLKILLRTGRSDVDQIYLMNGI